MKLYGPALEANVQAFFEAQFALKPEAAYMGIPQFSNQSKHFIGGHKGLYTVAEEVSANEYARLTMRTNSAGVESRVSVPFETGSRNIHHVLVLPDPTLQAEQRLALYGKKTRNQVRRSRESGLTVRVCKPQEADGWYEVYVQRVRELGSIPKDKSYFDLLARHCPDSVLLTCAYDSDVLVGFNYFVLAPSYLVLTQSASSKEYWPRYVNDLLYDETISFASTQGITRVDFGASSLGDVRHNHFKEGFGGKCRYFVEPRHGLLKRVFTVGTGVVKTKARSLFMTATGR